MRLCLLLSVGWLALASVGTRGDDPQPSASKIDAAKTDTAKIDTAKIDTAKIDTAKIDTAKIDTAKIDTAELEKRHAELERRLAAVQQELQEIRRELQRPARLRVAAMTPEEAVKAFQQDPKKLFTVEFGVESAGWPDGPTRVGESPLPPIMADWNGRLSNGGKFSLVLGGKAVGELKDIGIELPPAQPAGFADFQRLGVLCKQLAGKGVRVTGLLKASRPGERYTDYYILVDDPANFRVNK